VQAQEAAARRGRRTRPRHGARLTTLWTRRRSAWTRVGHRQTTQDVSMFKLVGARARAFGRKAGPMVVTSFCTTGCSDVTGVRETKLTRKPVQSSADQVKDRSACKEQICLSRNEGVSNFGLQTTPPALSWRR
jgi:hypothetical protein